jgi:CheY-like chemotaxis protein
MAKKVLVAEDAPHVIRLIETALSAAGYQVATAGDANEALSSVAADPPALIILDRALPGLQTHEVLERLKADPVTRDVPVIILSARSPAEALSPPDARVAAYLSKPFHPTWIVDLVRRSVTGP